MKIRTSAKESRVRVEDSVIWASHIEGDDALTQRILDMKEGDIIELEVAWFKGFWRKMRDSKNSKPTQGIKPLEEANKHWQSILPEHKGDTVRIWEVLDW